MDGRIQGKPIILHIKYIMRNSNNKRTEEQELKTIAKSAYSITNRPQFCLYQSKMQTIRRNQSKRKASSRINDQSTILERKSSSKKKVNTTDSLKQKFDYFVHEIFVQIDFDCSGFITATKISYYKHLPEEVFYFFGGIFQKIKQLGAVTQKVFMSLCDEAFVHAKVDDIEELLRHDLKERKQKEGNHQKTLLKKKENVEQKLHSLSCSQFKSIKFMKKSDIHEKSVNEPLLQRKASNGTISKRECLKKQLDCFTKRQCLSTGKQVKPFGLETQRKKEDSNFNSLKVKQLSQRLDRQIAHSQIRINLGKSIR